MLFLKKVTEKQVSTSSIQVATVDSHGFEQKGKKNKIDHDLTVIEFQTQFLSLFKTLIDKIHMEEKRKADEEENKAKEEKDKSKELEGNILVLNYFFFFLFSLFVFICNISLWCFLITH